MLRRYRNRRFYYYIIIIIIMHIALTLEGARGRDCLFVCNCRHVFWLHVHPDYIFLMYFVRCQMTVSVMLLLVLGPKVTASVSLTSNIMLILLFTLLCIADWCTTPIINMNKYLQQLRRDTTFS